MGAWVIILLLWVLLPLVFVILAQAVELVRVIGTDAAQRLSLIILIVMGLMVFGETFVPRSKKTILKVSRAKIMSAAKAA